MNTNAAIAAFMRVYNIVASLGRPVFLISSVIGAIEMITGNQHGGLKRIKQAGLGYLVVWFMPALASIIEDVGRTAQ